MPFVAAEQRLAILGAQIRSELRGSHDLLTGVVADGRARLYVQLARACRRVPVLVDGVVVDNPEVEAEMPRDQIGPFQLHTPRHDLRDIAENGLIVERAVVLERRGRRVVDARRLLIVPHPRLEDVHVQLQRVVGQETLDAQLEVQNLFRRDVRGSPRARELD